MIIDDGIQLMKLFLLRRLNAIVMVSFSSQLDFFISGFHVTIHSSNIERGIKIKNLNELQINKNPKTQ
jgi:hypothetical protein